MTVSRSQTTDLSVPLLVSVQTEEALLSWGGYAELMDHGALWVEDVSGDG